MVSYAIKPSFAALPCLLCRPHRLVWYVDSQAALLALIERESELYLVLDPLCDRETAMSMADSLKAHLLDKPIAADLLLPM